MSAVERFEEAARLTKERLRHFRTDAARATITMGGLPALEALSSLCWVACVLCDTAEEALCAKKALMIAGEQLACDQRERSELAFSCLQSNLHVAIAERDALREEAQQLGSRVRREGLTGRQRQAKDAARMLELTQQNAQLSANLRLSESAWAEERRADQVCG